jgi:hypothetical protein
VALQFDDDVSSEYLGVKKRVGLSPSPLSWGSLMFKAVASFDFLQNRRFARADTLAGR